MLTGMGIPTAPRLAGFPVRKRSWSTAAKASVNRIILSVDRSLCTMASIVRSTLIPAAVGWIPAGSIGARVLVRVIGLR
jgi:hypothetical protein